MHKHWIRSTTVGVPSVTAKTLTVFLLAGNGFHVEHNSYHSSAWDEYRIPQKGVDPTQPASERTSTSQH
jgi:hypothetical protein